MFLQIDLINTCSEWSNSESVKYLIYLYQFVVDLYGMIIIQMSNYVLNAFYIITNENAFFDILWIDMHDFKIVISLFDASMKIYEIIKWKKN